ncbi:hypothetical protein ERO13_D05G189400v2 [Gossypium hirsutum]|nr:hypothetical protein ERO13_D05G189400v2 [Gossypium hirsutum]
MDPKGTKKGMLGDEDIGSKSVTLKTLEGNLRRLKLKYENLASEKSCQIAALMAENKFAWNQFNIMETQFTDKLNSKNFELDKANRKIEALISNMEELRSSNAEKDEMIQILKSELSQKEADASRFHEVSKMSRQVEFLRKPRSSSHTPVIKHCTAREGTVLGDENGGGNKCSVNMKKGSSAPHVHDSLKDNGRGSRSSKRKKDDEIRISETPNLFTSTFKVPRLRDSSPKSR